MDFPRGYKIKRQKKISAFGIFSRYVILAFVILSFPLLGSVFRRNRSKDDSISDLGIIFRDLTNERLFKLGEKALFLGGANEESIFASRVLIDNKLDFISESDLQRQNSIPDDSFNFVFANAFDANEEFIDRILKFGGVAVAQLSESKVSSFQKPSNYKIVYLRKLGFYFVAMRKTKLPMQRKLMGFASEAKKAALKGLEDVLLEPPRASSGRSNRYLKKTKYLPDLTGDSLESYPRRVFIDVGSPTSDTDGGWFERNYPTRNRDFEMYRIETVAFSGKEAPAMGMSEWLRMNVKEEEYVVMKAEAEVVEDMVKSRAIALVDELFLECGKKQKGKSSSRRAYWECLALYGKLRDEGIAVHQWWG